MSELDYRNKDIGNKTSAQRQQSEDIGKESSNLAEINGKVNKRAVIVTNSTNFEPRAELVGRCLEEEGIEVTYIYSDFSHREKKKLDRKQPNHIYLPTLPYQKNLSLARIRSQMDFAEKMRKKLAGMEYDLLYVLLPANSLAKAAAEDIARKKGKADRTDRPRLVFDIIDLWPESLGTGRLKALQGTPPFLYWKNLRDKYLPAADLAVTECDLYREMLQLDPEKSMTLYWVKQGSADTKETNTEPESESEEQTEGKSYEQKTYAASDTEIKREAPGCKNTIRLAYLGAINNIIDIDGIVRVCKELQGEESGYKVQMEIIGDGEGRERFLTALKDAGIDYTYHGAVFNEVRKKEILQSCDFGLNLMKPGVCVGLTMKSIDYWSYGLPILNNIPGDTWRLVEDEGMGVNTDWNETWREAVQQKLSNSHEGLKKQRGKEPFDTEIFRNYENLFSEKSVGSRIKRYLLPLVAEAG